MRILAKFLCFLAPKAPPCGFWWPNFFLINGEIFKTLKKVPTKFYQDWSSHLPVVALQRALHRVSTSLANFFFKYFSRTFQGLLSKIQGLFRTKIVKFSAIISPLRRSKRVEKGKSLRLSCERRNSQYGAQWTVRD